MTPFFLSLPILLSATMPQSDATGFPPSGTVWTLSAVDGAAFDGNATLSFGEDGRIAGKGPCNTYTGALDGTPEEFSVGPLATTKMACPDMQPEQAFLDALQAMTTATMDGDTITLMAPDGRSMTFAQAQPGASVASDQEAPAEQAAPETAPDAAPTTETPADADAGDQGAAPEPPAVPAEASETGSEPAPPAADPQPADDSANVAPSADGGTPPAPTDSAAPDTDAAPAASDTAESDTDAAANGSDDPASETNSPAASPEAAPPEADAPISDADAPASDAAPEAAESPAETPAPETAVEPAPAPGSEQDGTLVPEEDISQ